MTVEAGDFQQERMGQGDDVALVVGVLNGEPPEGRPTLIGQVYERLEAGGLDTRADWDAGWRRRGSRRRTGWRCGPQGIRC